MLTLRPAENTRFPAHALAARSVAAVLRDGRDALRWAAAFPDSGFTLVLQKNPESKSVRDEQ